MSSYLPRLPSMHTVAQRGFYVVSGLLTVTGLLLYRFQCKLIYPAHVPSGSRKQCDTPDMYNMPDYRDETLETPDGVKIRAFIVPQPNASQRPTLLYLHANAGNMGHRLPIGRVFQQDFKMNLVMLSYRGYGLSEGAPDEDGIRIDAQTALDYIRKDADLSKTPVVLYGQSIGGAVAIDLAARNTECGIVGLIIENTFLSLPRLVPELMPFLKPFLFVLTQTWPSEQQIPKLTIPVLFLSGAKDEIVPPSHMKELHELCQSKNKEFKLFPTGTHNDTCVQADYFETIAVWLRDRVLSRPLRSSTFDPSRVEHEAEKLEKEGAEAGSRAPKIAHL